MLGGLIFAGLLLAVAVGAFVYGVRNPAPPRLPQYKLRGLPTAPREPKRLEAVPEDRSGWVYFVGGDEGPIKIGMSQYEPTSQRLHELKTMSPIPLKVYYKQWVSDRFTFETRIHHELAESRLHGEWFDRDVALYYASVLRGEA